jgi:uncharacterized OB-fold protein
MTKRVFELVETTPDSEEWWEGCRRREFLLQRCSRCAGCQHYPRALCTSCGSTMLEFVPGGKHGTIYSYSTIHRGEHSVLGTPYVVALVLLDEGPLVLTNLIGGDVHDRVACGDSAYLHWLPAADGRNVPVYALDEPQGKEG